MVTKELGSTSGNRLGNERRTMVQFTEVRMAAGLNGHIQDEVDIPHMNLYALAGFIKF